MKQEGFLFDILDIIESKEADEAGAVLQARGVLAKILPIKRKGVFPGQEPATWRQRGGRIFYLHLLWSHFPELRPEILDFLEAMRAASLSHLYVYSRMRPAEGEVQRAIDLGMLEPEEQMEEQKRLRCV